MIPFDFTVTGPPVSHQATDKVRLADWRNTVRQAATAIWPSNDPPSRDQLRIAVTYFHEGDAIRMDNDNMVKPIQDAIAGLVYVNDNQITDTDVRKTKLDGAFRVRGMPPVLGPAFCAGKEFIYVRISLPPDHTELLV